MMTSQGSCNCKYCGTAFQVEVHPSVNVSDNPDLKAQVMDGSLFVNECPQCGRINLIKYPLLYHDPDSRLMIWLSDGNPDQEAALQRTCLETEELKAYTARFVDDIGSLMEKVKIFDAGLDDRLVEMCKFVTCMEMGQDLSFKFFRLDGADGDITLTYPKDGQMEMVNIGFNVYEDCRGIIGRNPEIAREEGFSHVDADWVASILK